MTKQARKRALTPRQWLQFLNTPEAISALGAAEVYHQRKRIGRELARVQKQVPSSSWFAAFEGGAAFPPGGYELTAMVRCEVCERYYSPFVVTARGRCLDCVCCAEPYLQEQWGPSPFHSAMEVMRSTRAKLRF